MHFKFLSSVILFLASFLMVGEMHAAARSAVEYEYDYTNVFERGVTSWRTKQDIQTKIAEYYQMGLDEDTVADCTAQETGYRPVKQVKAPVIKAPVKDLGHVSDFSKRIRAAFAGDTSTTEKLLAIVDGRDGGIADRKASTMEAGEIYSVLIAAAASELTNLQLHTFYTAAALKAGIRLSAHVKTVYHLIGSLRAEMGCSAGLSFVEDHREEFSDKVVEAAVKEHMKPLRDKAAEYAKTVADAAAREDVPLPEGIASLTSRWAHEEDIKRYKGIHHYINVTGPLPRLPSFREYPAIDRSRLHAIKGERAINDVEETVHKGKALLATVMLKVKGKINLTTPTHKNYFDVHKNTDEVSYSSTNSEHFDSLQALVLKNVDGRSGESLYPPLWGSSERPALMRRVGFIQYLKKMNSAADRGDVGEMSQLLGQFLRGYAHCSQGQDGAAFAIGIDGGDDADVAKEGREDAEAERLRNQKKLERVLWGFKNERIVAATTDASNSENVGASRSSRGYISPFTNTPSPYPTLPDEGVFSAEASERDLKKKLTRYDMRSNIDRYLESATGQNLANHLAGSMPLGLHRQGVSKTTGLQELQYDPNSLLVAVNNLLTSHGLMEIHANSWRRYYNEDSEDAPKTLRLTPAGALRALADLDWIIMDPRDPSRAPSLGALRKKGANVLRHLREKYASSRPF